ncbi:Hypothetical protein, putative, partial [Bodo saltans]
MLVSTFSMVVMMLWCPTTCHHGLSERILCSSATQTTAVLQSNTEYLLEDCFVPPLPPSIGGGVTPIFQTFAGYLSPSKPTLTNVSITVRNSNVVPNVHIESLIPGLPDVMIQNISINIIGLQAVWPVGLANAVVESFLSIQEVSFVNVTLAFQSCVLNLTIPQGGTRNYPVFAWFRPPLPSTTAQYPQSSDAGIMIFDSQMIVYCNTQARPDLFVFEIPSSSTITDITVTISNSTITFQAVVWLSYPVSIVNVLGRDDYTGVLGITANTSVSNVRILTTNASHLSSMAILPGYSEPPQFREVAAAGVYLRVSKCNFVTVTITNGNRFEATVVPPALLPAPSPMTLIHLDWVASVIYFYSSESTSHVSCYCSNATALLTSVGRVYLFVMSAAELNINITIMDVFVNSVVTSGNSGVTGKEAMCVSINTTIGAEKMSITIVNTRLRSTMAADGCLGSSIIAVLLKSNTGMSGVTVSVRGFVLEASVAGAVSVASISELNAAILMAMTCLVAIIGAVHTPSVDVHGSQIQSRALFQCPDSASWRFTSEATNIVYIPGSISAAVFDIRGCTIDLMNMRSGFGGTPTLSASMSAGGSWDTNFVGVVSTVAQRIAYTVIPVALLPFMQELDARRDTTNASVLDGTTITIANTSIYSTDSAPDSPPSKTASPMIAIVGLYATTMRNTVLVLISDSTAFLSGDGSRQAWKTCRRPVITIPGVDKASVLVIAGTTIFESGTRIAVTRVAGVVGPLISGFSLVSDPAMLTLRPNTTISFAYVSSSGLDNEGSVLGLTSASASSSLFSVVVTADSTLQTPYGINLYLSSLCGFAYLAGPSSIVSSTMPATLTLLCNTWSPAPLAELLTLSDARLSASLVKT